MLDDEDDDEAGDHQVAGVGSGCHLPLQAV